MPFATDRDLLLLAPALFRDVSWLGQTLFRGTIRVLSGQLVISGGAFPATVQPGHVAVLDDRPLEITAITSATSLTVSLIRAGPDDPVLPPSDTGILTGSIATFTPQIHTVHDQLLRTLGLAPSAQAIDPAAPGESSVLNPRDLWLVEALGTLHLIYTAATASLAPDSTLAQRAAHFHERFNRERWRARALIDLDADGRPDATRGLSTLRLTA